MKMMKFSRKNVDSLTARLNKAIDASIAAPTSNKSKPHIDLRKSERKGQNANVYVNLIIFKDAIRKRQRARKD